METLGLKNIFNIGYDIVVLSTILVCYLIITYPK